MKKKFGKAKRRGQDMALQITSMADIFMILLVFLLKNYSTTLTSVSPSEGTRLPVAESQDILKEALKVEISKDSISVDHKPVIDLHDFRFSGRIDAYGETAVANPLYSAMQAERKKGRAGTDSNLVVLADERTPYDTIKLVMGSAARAGYVDLQLVVVEDK